MDECAPAAQAGDNVAELLLGMGIEEATRVVVSDEGVLRSNEHLFVDLLRAQTSPTTRDFESFFRWCTWFVLGGDPDHQLEVLRAEGALTARMCGSVWERGSIAYRCATCGTSPSSSICVSCFQAGEHTGHDFNIYSSGFGGCCDCGNASAWSESGFCKHHSGKIDGHALDALPREIQIRAGSVCRSVCKLLMRGVQQEFLVQYGVNSTDVDAPSKYFALPALAWLRKTSNYGDAFRSVVGKEVLEVCLRNMEEWKEGQPLPHSLMYELGSQVRNEVADELINLYLELLYDDDFRMTYMDRFIRLYPLLGNRMLRITNQEEKRGFDDFINRVTAQLWNMDDMMERVVRSGNGEVIEVVLQTLHFVLEQGMLQETLPLSADCTNPVQTLELYWSFSSDLASILTDKSNATFVCVHRPDLFSAVASALLFSQNSDMFKRKTGAHVLREGEEWKYALHLELEIARLIPPFDSVIAQLYTDTPGDMPVERQREKQRTLLSILQYQLEASFVEALDIDIYGAVVPFDVLEGEISIHLPLHRMFVSMIQKAVEGGAEFASIATKDEEFWLRFVEQPLRVQAFLAQYESGLWVRNGRPIAYKGMLYRTNFLCYDTMFDPDIMALQLAVAVLGAERVMRLASQRFSVLKAARGKRTDLWAKFIHFIIVLAKDRARHGMTDDDMMRREMLHRLCIEDQSFSAISKSMCRRLNTSENFEPTLKELANYHASEGMKEARYELKKKYWDEFDMYHCRYAAREQQQALERYQSIKKTKSVPPPRYAPRENALAAVSWGVLCCPETLKVVWYHLHSIGSSLETNEECLIGCLHILYMATEKCLASDPVEEGSGVIAPASYEEAFQYPRLDQNVLQEVVASGETEQRSIVKMLLQTYQRVKDDPDVPYKELVATVLRSLATASGQCRAAVEQEAPDLASPVEKDSDRAAEAERRKKAKRLAAQRRQRMIMESFKKKQMAFLETSGDVLGDDDEGLDGSVQSGADEEGDSAARHECSLCHEWTDVSSNSPEQNLIGLVTYCQRTKARQVWQEFDRDPQRDGYDVLGLDIPSITSGKKKPRKGDDSTSAEGDAMQVEEDGETTETCETKEEGNDDDEECAGASALSAPFAVDVHVGTCGHYVHVACLHRYFATLCEKNASRQWYEGLELLDLYRGEFLCPSCRRLCNSLLPSLPMEASTPQLGTSLQCITAPTESIAHHKKACLSAPTAEVAAVTTADTATAFPFSPVPAPEACAKHDGNVLIATSKWASKVKNVSQGKWIHLSAANMELHSSARSLAALLGQNVSLLEHATRSNVDGSFICGEASMHVQHQYTALRLVQQNLSGLLRGDPQGAQQLRLSVYDELAALFRSDDEACRRALSTDAFHVLSMAVCLMGDALTEELWRSLVQATYVMDALQACASARGDDSAMRGSTSSATELLSSLEPALARVTSCTDVSVEEYQRRVLPFLRRVLLLRDVITDKQTALSTTSTFASLCAALDLPTIEALLESGVYPVREWLAETDVRIAAHPPLRVFSFIELPTLYQTMYGSIATQTCAVCEERSTTNAAICLVCGEFICGGAKHAPVGMASNGYLMIALNKHAIDCTNRVGVFWLLKLCTTVVVRDGRFAVWGSLYLDEHGEQDFKLARGKPLFRNDARMEELRSTFMQHAFEKIPHVLEGTREIPHSDG